MLSFRQRLRERFRKTEDVVQEGNDSASEQTSLNRPDGTNENSARSRRLSSINESRSIEDSPSEEFHFIVDYVGSATISEAQSVQVLLETLKRVKKQQLRTIRVDFTIREGMLKVNSVDSNASILTAPLYAVALCAQEQLRGFDNTFGLNITRKRTHMCHVFQAGSHLEAGSIVRSVALAFKTIGRMLREKKDRERLRHSNSISSSDRTRTNSEASTTSTMEEVFRDSRRRQALLRYGAERESSASSSGRKSPHSNKHMRSFPKSSTSPSILRHTLSTHQSGRHVEFLALSPVPSDSSDNEGIGSVKLNSVIHEDVETPQDEPDAKPGALQVQVEVYTPPRKLGSVVIPTEDSVPELKPPVKEEPNEEIPEAAGAEKAVDPVVKDVVFSRIPDTSTEPPIVAEQPATLSSLKKKIPERVALPPVDTSPSLPSPPMEPELPEEEVRIFEMALKAIEGGDIDRLEKLLDDGLSENASDKSQQSLLYHAVLLGQVDVAQLLLRRGAEVNWEGPEDRTPLHVAAAEGNRSVTQLLLAHGANVRAKDNTFCTPLHLSVGKLQNLEVSHVLVEHGARICENNIQGVRPVDLELQLKEMQRLLVQSACEAFTSTDLSKSRSNSGTSSCNQAPLTSSFRSPRMIHVDSLRRSHRSSSLCSIPRGGVARASPETVKGVGSLRRSESINMSRTLSPLLAHSKRSGLRRSQSFQKYPRDLKFEQEIRERIEANMKQKVDVNDKNTTRILSESSQNSPSNLATDKSQKTNAYTTPTEGGNKLVDGKEDKFAGSEFDVSPHFMSRQRSNSDLARYTNEKIPASEKQLHVDLIKFGDGILESDKQPLVVSLTESVDIYDSMLYRASSPTPSSSSSRPKNIRQHSMESETSAGHRSTSECEDSSFISSGSQYGKDEDPVIESLKSVVLLSGNPECHASLLAYLCLPKASGQLLSLSHTPGILPTIAENVAVLIGNLFNLEGPESRKRSVEAGLIKTVLKLADGVEPIQSTCLSILHNILDFDNDREYSTALKTVPLEPLLNILHCNDTDSGAFDVRNTESPPPYPHQSMERGRRRKTSSCSRGSHEERHSIRELSPVSVCGSSVQRDNSAASDARSDMRRMFQKRNSISSMASSVEGDQGYSLYSPAYSHGHLPWTSLGPDMHTKNLPRLVATKMLAATSVNPKMQQELGKLRPLTLLLETLHDSNHDIVMHTIATLANIAMNIENHLQIETSGAVEAFKQLLSHQEQRISFHAARGLVYMGHMDVRGVYLFKHISGDDKLDVIFADTTGAEQLYVRGATVEKIVEIVTNNPSILWGGSRLLPSSPKGNRSQEKKNNGRNGSPNNKHHITDDQIADFILTMHKSFVHPVILMRLLIHRFRNPWFDKYFDGDPSTGEIERFDPLPIAHIHLMRLWKCWLDKHPDSFINNPIIASELSYLLVPMRRAAGPYLPCAESLEHFLHGILERTPGENRKENSHENHCHHSILYEQCQKAVVGGGLPCHIDDAIYLAALQLYIEDLSPTEARGRFESRFFQGGSPEKLSVSRVKQSLNPSMYKVKNIAKRIRAQHEHFQNEGVCERNAKHNYIDCCQAMPGYGCRFFRLKECLGTISRKSGHVNRLFGVSPKKVVLLDERTKGVVGNWQFNEIKRWKSIEDDTKLRVEFVNIAFEFVLENRSHTFKEISDLLFYCTKSNLQQALGENDFSPWSKYAEDTETWGAMALEAEARQQLPSNQHDEDPVLSDPARIRAVSCISTSVPRPRRFQRGFSMVNKLSSSAPYPCGPLAPGQKGLGATNIAPILAATASAASPLVGSSVQSSRFGSSSTMQSSEEQLLGSLQSTPGAGSMSSTPSASAAPSWTWNATTPQKDRPLLVRNPSQSSEGSVENSPTELHPLRSSFAQSPASPTGPPSRRHRYLSTDSSSSSLGAVTPVGTLPLTEDPSHRHSGIFDAVSDTDVENMNRMFGLSPKGQLLNCRCPPGANLPDLDRRNFTVYELLMHPKELARQITLIDHEYFCAVTADDIQKKIAVGTGKKRNVDTEQRLQVERVADRFNQLSTWVVASILTEESPEKRAHMYVNFIETAKQCLELRNFNAVMAIVVAALGSAPIRRLARTKEFVPKEYFEQYSKIELLMDTKNNYKRYRTTLRASPTPAVPYFGIYMKDLTFIAEGNPDFLKGGLVNLSKRRQVYIVINEIRQFQKKSYHFQEVAEVREYLLSQKQVTEEDLHLVSCQLEPSLARRYSETDKPADPQRPVPKLTRSNTLGRMAGLKLVLEKTQGNSDSNC